MYIVDIRNRGDKNVFKLFFSPYRTLPAVAKKKKKPNPATRMTLFYAVCPNRRITLTVLTAISVTGRLHEGLRP